MLYTHKPLTHYLESWTAEHFGRHDDPAWLRYLDARQKYLGLKTAEQAREHDNGGLLGMSKAGSCLRAVAAGRAGLEGVRLSAAELVTFEIGHLLEVAILAVLEAAGFELDGTQVEARLGDTHRSAVDGILRGGPVDLPYPIILSAKTQGWKMAGYSKTRKAQDRRGFSALPVAGIEREKFSWHLQSMLEMAALGINHAVVVVLAKDRIASWDQDQIMKDSGSLCWYAEVIPFDRPVAEELWREHRKLVRNYAEVPLQAPARVPRSGGEGTIRWIDLPVPGDEAHGWGGKNQEATGDFNDCKGCKYRKFCYRPEMSLEDQLKASLEAL